ncbi:MAG: NADH-quinone oxidoreductase subunit NuoK [Pseudonocardiaceae bacterium]
MHIVIAYLIAALLAGIGVYGVMVRRNTVLLLMAVELILAAVTLIFVAADTVHGKVAPTGQVFALFVIVLAAAEIGIGLAIVLRLYRSFSHVDITTVDATRADDVGGENLNGEGSDATEDVSQR